MSKKLQSKTRISLIVMIVFYFAAGINHFRNPSAYYLIIPPWLTAPELVNAAAGIFEIILAIGLIFPATRRWAAWGIIAMLIAFIPSHIYMIQQGGCFPKPGFCFPVWVMWVRLMVLQPLLIWWAYAHRK
ncbi:MAG: MauE/DoxX family redox-associated membrane protein [Bacteroidota bacterium]